VALETSRGWRIAKEKTSHKIEVVAALGAVLGDQMRDSVMEYITRQLALESGKPGVGLCANPACRKPLPEDGNFYQARGLRFCSNSCSW
jgi:hypothetical protein